MSSSCSTSRGRWNRPTLVTARQIVRHAAGSRPAPARRIACRSWSTRGTRVSGCRPPAASTRPRSSMRSITSLPAAPRTGALAFASLTMLPREGRIPGGNNRIILAASMATSMSASRVIPTWKSKLIEKERGDGIFLTVLGVGYGNLKVRQAGENCPTRETATTPTSTTFSKHTRCWCRRWATHARDRGEGREVAGSSSIRPGSRRTG